jgi:hypothetical protein
MSTIRRSSRITRAGLERTRQTGAPQPAGAGSVEELADIDSLEASDGETRSGLDGDGGDAATVMLSDKAMNALLDDLLADMSDEDLEAEAEQAEDYGRTGRLAVRGGAPDFRDDGSTTPMAFDSQQISALETMTLRRGERAPNLRGAQEALDAQMDTPGGASAEGPKSVFDSVTDASNNSLESAIDRARRIRAKALSSADPSARLVAAQASIAEMDARAELAEGGTMSIHDLLRATQIPTLDLGELSTQHEVAGRYEANAEPDSELPADSPEAPATSSADELLALLLADED